MHHEIKQQMYLTIQLTIQRLVKHYCLNELRHKIFMEKVAGRSVVTAQLLPPTEDAAQQHFFRFTVQIWLCRYIDPRD